MNHDEYPKPQAPGWLEWLIDGLLVALCIGLVILTYVYS